MRFPISVVSCCWKVIIWPRYFVLSSLVNISTLMSSISISFLMFELRLLRIFVFPGYMLSPTFPRAALEVTRHFFEDVALLKKQKKEYIVSKAHIREAVVIVVSQVNTHSPCLLPAWKVVFQCHLQKSVEEQARLRITLLGSFFDLEHVTFFVSHYSGFL